MRKSNWELSTEEFCQLIFDMNWNPEFSDMQMTHLCCICDSILYRGHFRNILFAILTNFRRSGLNTTLISSYLLASDRMILEKLSTKSRHVVYFDFLRLTLFTIATPSNIITLVASVTGSSFDSFLREHRFSSPFWISSATTDFLFLDKSHDWLKIMILVPPKVSIHP